MTNGFWFSSAAFGKYRRMGIIFILLMSFFASSVYAQSGCSKLTPTFINYEPCKFRVKIVNLSECTPFITVNIDPGAFATWSVNSAAGFSGQLLAPNIIQITHNGGFIPLGTSFPLIFTLPPGLLTEGNFTWEFNCGIGEGCTLFPGIPLTSCPDPVDASIIGVKYRECQGKPYVDQPVLSGWPIQLLDSLGNVLGEQLTDADGAYGFFDLPYGKYIIKEAFIPGWTANIPQSGQYDVFLDPSEKAVANFGNCPSCSCDSITMTVQPISSSGGVCCYRAIVQNNDTYCFPNFKIEVPAGLNIGNVSVTAAGWSTLPLSSTLVQVSPPSGFIPAGTAIPVNFCVSGGTLHNITLSTFYSNGQMSILCQKPYTFDCAAQGFCPDNYVRNGNFEQGTPPGTDESISFAANWSAIWTGCSSTADFYNTVFAPPLGVANPMPVSQGNFGGMWAKPHGSNLIWREGMMNAIFPISANSGTYKMEAKIACLTNVLPNPNAALPEIEVWGVPVGSPALGTCPGLTGPNSSIFTGAVQLGSFQPTASCDKNFQYFNNIVFPAPNVAIDRIFLTRKQPGAGQAGSDVYVAMDDICLTKISGGGCVCRDTSGISVTADGVVYHVPCRSGPSNPVIPCPKTSPVTISSDFGCVDGSGAPCQPPSPVDWILYGPSGIVQQGAFVPSTSPWTLTFNASDFTGVGNFTLYMTSLCAGQVDSCKCIATWFQECPPSCNCGNDPFDMSIRYGGAMNTPFDCGDTVPVTPNSVVYINFQCQALPCNPSPTIDWKLTGPNGYMFFQNGVPATGFSIPQLQPTNFPYPGTYCLELWGHCGLDTCPCKVYFCLPPDAPTLNDTSICRTLTSAYIPIIACPSGDCDITQVDWYVKPCSAASFPPLPYQISPGPGCDPLLLLPYQYPNEACVLVYAVVHLADGCCVRDLVTNVATVNLCNPITCSILNLNIPICQSGQPSALTAQAGNANCNYSVEWYDDGGQLVSTQAVYTPAALTFPAGSSACYKDFVYTLKIKGVCGVSTCTTSIRVYNTNADNGDLSIDPVEPLPLCPGEDVILKYTDKCSGPPPKWTWYSSTDGVNYTPVTGAGMMNNILYSNHLWQTTWYQVVSQNGVCPPKTETLKVDVKDPLTLVSFTAIPDACVAQMVNMSIDFLPSPNQGGGPAGCGYTIQWFMNGNLINTSSSQTSPVSYTYSQPGNVAGVYYAVVTDDCCGQSIQGGPVVINPTCEPLVGGPCYICGQGPVTLVGEMILPPQDPCPPNVACTFQWYKLDTNTGIWMPISGETGTSLTITAGGHYRWETVCDYGYGPCIKSDDTDVVQCKSTGNGCVKVDASEPYQEQMLEVELQPNPTSGDLNILLHPAILRNGRVAVVDMDGRELISALLPEGEQAHRISLAKLPNGLYFVHVYEGQVPVWTGKVVRAE